MHAPVLVEPTCWLTNEQALSEAAINTRSARNTAGQYDMRKSSVVAVPGKEFSETP